MDASYCLVGEVEGRESAFPLSLGQNFIGRDLQNQIVLSAIGVSRFHALAKVESGVVEVIDQGSKNGVAINGERVHRCFVPMKGQISIGPVDLRLEEARRVSGMLATRSRLPFASWSEDPTVTIRSIPGVGGSGFDSTKSPGATLLFPKGYEKSTARSMASIYRRLGAVAGDTLSVMLTGETGVGKEMLAKAVHLSSSRRKAPFVAINCAAIPASLFEAELFGACKGAATDVKASLGKFREADGGTLFLDEIGEMDLELQSKLLRALDTHEVCPVGGKSVEVDVRIISATNARLDERVETGAMRTDLYYRLSGLREDIPPLRERSEDIKNLAQVFLRRFCRLLKRSNRGLEQEVFDLLESHDWPGNVRELEHEIRRAVNICSPGRGIRATDFSKQARGARLEETASAIELPTLNVEELTGIAMGQALMQTQGNLTQAAKLTGMDRHKFRRLARKLGLIE